MEVQQPVPGRLQTFVILSQWSRPRHRRSCSWEMLPMQTAPHGFDNFCTPSLQDGSCDAMTDGRARPAGNCGSISSQLCARLWKRNVSPQTRHSDPDLQYPLPCRHTAVSPASRQLLPSLLAAPSLPSARAQPALLLGKASELSPGSGSIPSAFPLSHRVTHHL